MFTKEQICGICQESVGASECPYEDPCNALLYGIYCHVCGNPNLVYEGLAESYWCPQCGSSDSDS